jgi:hypothetical protein
VVVAVGPGAGLRRCAAPGLIVVLCAAVAAAGFTWFAPLHLEGSAFTATDFQQYCEAVSSRISGVPSENPHRSWLLADAFVPLARAWGLGDALAAGGAISLFVACLGMALHAGAVGGRRAALLTVAMCIPVAPVVLMSRTLSFYPAMTAWFSLACGAAAWTAARGGWPAGLAAAALAAACPLVDLRGIVWMAPCGVAVLIGLAVGRTEGGEGWRTRGLAIAGALALVGLSYRLGSAVWARNVGGSLENQLWSSVSDVYMLAGGRLPPIDAISPACHPPGFVWGRTGLADGLDSMDCLRALAAAAKEIPPNQTSRLTVERQLEPWFLPTVAACAVAGVALLRRPRALLALWLPLAPAAALLAGASAEPDLRRLEQAMVLLPIVFGVAGGSLFDAIEWLARRVFRAANPRRLDVGVLAGEVAIGVFLTLAVCGIVATPLSPVARWRVKFNAQSEYLHFLDGTARARPGYETTCAAALADERNRGNAQPLLRHLSERPGWN